MSVDIQNYPKLKANNEAGTTLFNLSVTPDENFMNDVEMTEFQVTCTPYRGLSQITLFDGESAIGRATFKLRNDRMVATIKSTSHTFETGESHDLFASVSLKKRAPKGEFSCGVSSVKFTEYPTLEEVENGRIYFNNGGSTLVTVKGGSQKNSTIPFISLGNTLEYYDYQNLGKGIITGKFTGETMSFYGEEKIYYGFEAESMDKNFNSSEGIVERNPTYFYVTSTDEDLSELSQTKTYQLNVTNLKTSPESVSTAPLADVVSLQKKVK